MSRKLKFSAIGIWFALTVSMLVWLAERITGLAVDPELSGVFGFRRMLVGSLE